MIVRPRGKAVRWFALAALLASAGLLLTLRAAARQPATSVVVAAVDLPLGADPAVDGSTTSVSIPRSAVLPGMISDVAVLGGRRLVAPVASGEPITQSTVGGTPGASPAPLQPGERALSLPATQSDAVVAVLSAGARVDLVATSPESSRPVVIRGSEVLSVQHAGHDDISGASSIIVRLASSDAVRLGAMLDRGATLRVLPRPFAEDVGQPMESHP